MIAPPPPTPRILIMLNGWTQVFSGGDYHILKVTERWKSSLSLTFLMPRPAVDGMGGSVAGQVIFSSGESAEGIPSIPVVIWRYLIRCAVSIIKASQLHPDVVIAASHFLPDIVPA